MGKSSGVFKVLIGVVKSFKFSSSEKSAVSDECVSFGVDGNGEMRKGPQLNKRRSRSSRKWDLRNDGNTGLYVPTDVNLPDETKSAQQRFEMHANFEADVDHQNTKTPNITSENATSAAMAQVTAQQNDSGSAGTKTFSCSEFSKDKLVSDRCERAARKIQTAFRAYLARRALRALRGVIRLQALARGHLVRKQTASSFRCMQALARVQARLPAGLSELELGAQRPLRQKPEQREKSRVKEWDSSPASSEEVQAKAQYRHTAAKKRERALAYAFAEQLRTCAPETGSAVIECEAAKKQWEWRWLERWMAAKSWESSFPGLARKHVSAVNALKVKAENEAPKVAVPVKRRNVSMTDIRFHESFASPARSCTSHPARPSPNSPAQSHLYVTFPTTTSNSPARIAREDTSPNSFAPISLPIAGLSSRLFPSTYTQHSLGSKALDSSGMQDPRVSWTEKLVRKDDRVPLRGDEKTGEGKDGISEVFSSCNLNNSPPSKASRGATNMKPAKLETAREAIPGYLHPTQSAKAKVRHSNSARMCR